MKRCGYCKIEKPFSDFFKDKIHKYGLSYRCKECDKKYQHSVSYRKQRKIWQKNKIQRNMNFRLQRNLRTRLCMALKNKQKAGSAIQDLGCSIEKLKEHLEKQFQPNMSWNNYGHGKGKWNIDHIKELRSFDLTDRKQFLEATNFTNLQPLWTEQNTEKRNKFGESSN